MMEIRFGRLYDMDYILDMIEKTTLDDLQKIIGKIFVKENFMIQGLYKNKIRLNVPEF